MEAELTYEDFPFLKELGIEKENLGCFNGSKWVGSGKVNTQYNPATGKPIAHVKFATPEEYEQSVQTQLKNKAAWMSMPMPLRGDIVREVGVALREKKVALGKLVSLEMGKITVEGEGEVQEGIDICEMACGLSRSINGQIIPSERPSHFMMEQWNPLGLVGVISAFNFPCAVFFWNFAIAAVCGDLTMWKGASSTSLVTIACTKIVSDILKKYKAPDGVLTMCQGSGKDIGELMINDPRYGLISFTGSTAIGKRISTIVHERFGRTILELGGNNAVIVAEDANLELVLKGCTFSAVGTCGQRCTSLRRMIIHKSKYDELVERFVKAYSTIRIGDPLDKNTLCGPLHTEASVKEYLDGIAEIKKQGGKILCGGKRIEGKAGFFVEPTIVEIDKNAPILKEELFVPIMYVLKFDTVEEAIEMNNNVPQGLSSAIFTNNVKNVMKWVGPLGSDCGIVNVNIGPSGAEIGGAFGGEKETGGGRESGSDSWKQYMRRATCTINYGNDLPLAQGIKFE